MKCQIKTVKSGIRCHILLYKHSYLVPLCCRLQPLQPLDSVATSTTGYSTERFSRNFFVAFFDTFSAQDISGRGRFRNEAEQSFLNCRSPIDYKRSRIKMADTKEQNCELKAELSLKHDWYQTEQAVVITILVKNVKNEFLRVNISESIVRVDLALPDFNPCTVCFNLSHKIIPDQSNYKLTPSKIEVKLKKLEGIRWDKLEGAPATEGIKTIPQDPIPQLSGPPSYPTSKKGKDWSAVEKEIKKQEEQEKPEGEEAINKLFQEIYGKGSDDVKRAMNKSYMESGGTVLSTNWDEISKQKVEVKPPDGMEFKKWN